MSQLSVLKNKLGPPLVGLTSETLHTGRWKSKDLVNSVPCDGSIRVIVPISQTHHVWHHFDGAVDKLSVETGSPWLLPMDRDFRVETEGEFDIFAVSVEGWAAPEEVDSYALNSRAGQKRLAHIMRRLLLLSIHQPPSRALQLEQMALELRATLETTTEAVACARGGLAPWQVRKVVDLVDSALDQPIAILPSLSDMASLVGLSVFHFARAFRMSTGVTPYSYALHARLKRIEHTIAHERTSVERLAHRYGFASAAHLVQQFRLQMGVTPSKWARAVAQFSDQPNEMAPLVSRSALE